MQVRATRLSRVSGEVMLTEVLRWRFSSVGDVRPGGVHAEAGVLAVASKSSR
jgi:hypothetical protein